MLCVCLEKNKLCFTCVLRKISVFFPVTWEKKGKKGKKSVEREREREREREQAMGT